MKTWVSRALSLALIFFVSFAWGIGTTGVVNGTIVDRDTQQAIPQASITLKSPAKTYVTTSDSEGFFSITGVAAGTYELTLDRIGYSVLQLSSIVISPDATTNLRLQLSTEPLVVPGVTVTAPRIATALTPSQTVTNYGYSDQEARKIFPGPASLNTRTLSESLPGIQTGYDAYYGSSTAHIRGGTGYDIGYAFDGVPTYENITFTEAKFNGIGTNFTNVGTAHTDVYVGAYPAQYGNFISGFINQTAKRGYGPLHATLEVQSGMWMDQGNRLPTYDPNTGNLSAYTGDAPYNPTNINFELSGKDRRFSYYFNHILQDGGSVSYSSGVDLKPLIDELGGTLPFSTQSRDTVLNFNYDLDPRNDLQLLFYTGISKLNYAGFAELPCNVNITSGCAINSNPAGTGFNESFNAFNIRALNDTHDEYAYDLEKFEWSHRFEKTQGLLNLRFWQYSPTFFFNRFDLPSTLWEFERSVNQGVLVEQQNQITRKHLINAGASFVYSKNYFLSSQTDLDFPSIGSHYNPWEGIIFGFAPGQSQPGVADIIRVPDTQTWSGWITDEWRPTAKWLIEGGLRWDKQNTLRVTGGGIVTGTNGLPFVTPSFCSNQGLCLDPARFNPSQISPRIGASYRLSDKLLMKASFGKFVTFPPARRIESVRYSSTSASSSVFLPGFPANTPAAFQLLGSKSQYGQNFDVSWEYELDGNTTVKLTPYVKQIKDPLQSAIVNGFPTVTNAGTIVSQGVELLMKSSEWNGISGWFSYTLSSTRGSQLPFQTDLTASVLDTTRGFTQSRQISDGAQMVPTAYDQRHTASLNLNIKRGNWEFSPNLTYGSGYPYGLGVNQLSALAALQDPQSYLYGGPHTVAQSVAATAGFNPLGEKGFDGLRLPAWWLGNLAVTYHFNHDTSMILNIFNIFNSSQILDFDNTVLSGVGYNELTNPNIACCYTSNDATKNILPQYNPLKGQYAPIAFPNLRQFYLTFQVAL